MQSTIDPCSLIQNREKAIKKQQDKKRSIGWRIKSRKTYCNNFKLIFTTARC